MRKTALIFALLSFCAVQAQILAPVKWKTSVKKISETEYELVATAAISGDWHLYSQSVPENGPSATSFTFKGNPNYLKKGNTREDQGHTIDDKVFKMKIKYFEKKADFRQTIKVKNKKKGFKINAVVEFMVCNDSQCLPPSEEDLVFEIK
ncbi:protein-disulfide reductase DsbD domain-containing protein [Flavobacterium luteolum]|uniref:protein-disulfide reductase DsbD domain-containing protein n=1 Tax=Flavobacterium luteolum TaxID=3003259 RepID=UPI00248DB8DA|nr:protein-disulfide reductase DsbD domain-containing protein [Flavobacterium luteolum]